MKRALIALCILTLMLAGCSDKPKNPDPIYGGCYLSSWTGKWICE